MKSRFELKVTMVADEFIDRYMAAANGEYVKVYLYILRHQNRDVTVMELADALNHTESDVRRALAYWERLGVLAEQKAEEKKAAAQAGAVEAAGRTEAACTEVPRQTEFSRQPEVPRQTEFSRQPEVLGQTEFSRQSEVLRQTEPSRPSEPLRPAEPLRQSGVREAASAVQRTAQPSGENVSSQRTLYTPEQVGRLAEQEDFTQLLYIAQKFMNKVFTPRECEVFAYLYDGLHMPSELLEYLVEYCVQGGHYSIRYLETVALSWKERGIVTADMARQQTASFSADMFAVMKAFGLQDRRPGSTEIDTIRRWFADFPKEVVLEACARTLRAIQKPSFSYADKILSEWKKAGVRGLSDLGALDEKMRGERGRQQEKQGRGSSVVRPRPNQFHNFNQRSTDYDAIVLERLKERLGE